MLWGFFKKIVIADNLAILVDGVYNNVDNYSGLTLIVATIFFTFQIYCDFSGYSDIAKGTAAATASTGYEIINLGNDNPTVLSDVIEMIENMTEKEARIEYKPTHKADVKATWANISRAKALLDWTPQVSLEEGLQKTVDWYMENRAWAKSLHIE